MNISKKLLLENPEECYLNCARYATFVSRDDWKDDRGNLSKKVYKHNRVLYHFVHLNDKTLIESGWNLEKDESMTKIKVGRYAGLNIAYYPDGTNRLINELEATNLIQKGLAVETRFFGKGCSIEIKGQTADGFILARLVDSNGKMLINAELEYIYQQLKSGIIL